MSYVIVLSDSDEPASAVPQRYENEHAGEVNEKHDFDATDDFDFPEVPFCRERESSTLQKEKNTSSVSPKRRRRRWSQSMSDPKDNYDERISPQSQMTKPTKKDKNLLKQERQKRQQTLAKEKALRAIASKKARDMKSGECMKFMEVNLDRGIDAFAFRTEIRDVLQNANIRLNVTTELIPNSITWRRNLEEDYIDEDNEVHVRKIIQTEKYTIVIWSVCEAVKHVAEGTFCTSVLDIKTQIPNYNMTLVIFGMEEYFVYRKKTREKSNQSPRSKNSKRNSKDNKQFEAFPIISRQQLEMCLTETQIVAKCNSRLIENAQDLALMIYQYTKSISEIPYKLQKKSEESKLDWYVTGDNRNIVCVDKDGNGLKRLWQQQLYQFNLCTLEIAEAICNAYPSPAQLVEAYRNCTPNKGMDLLKDIPIRRAAGPLTNVRKIGPELSKKLYVMFTSQNGDTLLGTE